jgi:hypothetical protein
MWVNRQVCFSTGIGITAYHPSQTVPVQRATVDKTYSIVVNFIFHVANIQINTECASLFAIIFLSLRHDYEKNNYKPNGFAVVRGYGNGARE